MHGGDDTHEEVEPHAIPRLQSHADGFAPDSSDSRLAVRLISEGVVHVVRQLAVNTDRLQTMQHGVAGSFEHWCLVSGLWFGLRSVSECSTEGAFVPCEVPPRRTNPCTQH